MNSSSSSLLCGWDLVEEMGDFEGVESLLITLSQILVGLFILLSFLSSVLIILVLFFSKKLNGVKILYVNILATDVLLDVTGILTFIVPHCASCTSFMGYAITVNGYVSAYTMIAISALRYLVICHPLKMLVLREWSKSPVPFLLLVLLLWGVSVGVALTFYPFQTFPLCDLDIDPDPGGPLTLISAPRAYSKPWVCLVILKTVAANSSVPWTSFIGFVIIPLFFGGFFSLKTILYLLSIEDEAGVRRSYIKSAILIAAMISTFVLFWAPNVIYFLIAHYKLYGSSGEFLSCGNVDYLGWLLTSFPVVTQPAVNPLLYWFFGEEFRKDARVLLQRAIHKIRVPPKTTAKDTINLEMGEITKL